MAKIYGDQENIKYARSAPAGARDVYVNMDAINDLPEEYEATINCVEYDPKRLADSFSNVGTEKSPSWMPKPEFMYKVAEATGINGAGISEVTPLIEEVDINPMLCKPIDAQPNYQRKNVGRSVSRAVSSWRMAPFGIPACVLPSITSGSDAVRHGAKRRCIPKGTASLPNMATSTKQVTRGAPTLILR